MKIAIVTIYNSYNYGAYLQAFALYRYLLSEGHEVFFVKNNVRNIPKKMVKKVLTGIVHCSFKDTKFEIYKLYGLLKSQKKLQISSLRRNSPIDYVIFGSDEIWNCSRGNIQKNRILFGEGISFPKISYAPSVNNANYADFKANPDLITLLKSFKSISVRDNKSKEVIMQVTGKSVSTVVDPTLLLSAEKYRQYEKKLHISEDFVLVYSYGVGDEELYKKIISETQKDGLKSVSILKRLDYCDLNIGVDPFQAIYLFDKAKYVITDTFHGLMLSLIFRKKIVISSITSDKLREAVELFGLQSRVFNNETEIRTVLKSEMDYQGIEKKMQSEIQKSYRYISDNLK